MSEKTPTWPLAAPGLKQNELMDEMIERQGLDLPNIVSTGESFVEARARCRSCPQICACRDWLLGSNEAQAGFCPNLDFFASLKREGE